MSKFSTPLLVCFAIAAVVGIGGWRSSSRNCSTAMTEWMNTSNKLAEATARLAEQGAATETLRMQLNLHKSDLTVVSNQIAGLNERLGKSAAEASGLHGEIGARDAQINSITRSNSQLIGRINALESQVGALQNALDSAMAQIATTTKQLDSTVSALNGLESTNASLLAKLSDPSALRAQLRTVTAPPSSLNDRKHAQLALNPDGTVRVLAPQEEEKPGKAETKPAEPVFRDISPGR